MALTMKKTSYGFTLVETAIVLVIMGILMISILPPLSKRMEQQRIAFTQQRLEEIKEALLNYAVQGYAAGEEPHLPCPAIDDTGLEGRTSTLYCTNYDNSDGYLPWATLGVEGYDGWGNPFRYRVDGYFSNNDGIYPPAAYNSGQPPGTSKSAISVRDRAGNKLNDETALGSNVVAVIFSCGQNGRPDAGNAQGTITTAVCDNNTANISKDVYVQDAYVPKQFDDIVIWISKPVVINRFVETGQWPPVTP
jgi:prepilin-type N-terminal cleavage/methylation domain-containing protein